MRGKPYTYKKPKFGNKWFETDHRGIKSAGSSHHTITRRKRGVSYVGLICLPVPYEHENLHLYHS